VGSPQNYNVLRARSPFDDYVLHWSDAFGASGNDYDLFLLNSTGTTVKGFSTNTQSGSGDPVEEIYVPGGSANNDRLVVVLFSGSPRALHIDTERGVLTIATSGATIGHNAGLNTVSMAATAWNSAHAGTRPFNGTSNPVEVFSSDGPRKIFFNPNGTAITPGNFLFATAGGATLQKPDLTAADGVFTKTPGFLPFFGTSAAAPHAAAIAALVAQARPDYTNAQIKAAMVASALDNMAPGADRDGGFGVAMALQAVQYALAH
jgi:subtilisin family serine protease